MFASNAASGRPHILVLLRPCVFAWFLLASSSIPAQAPDEPRVMPSKDRAFRIPFQTQPGERNLREVRLYYSTDQGRGWQLFATATPAQGFFQNFTATADGSYWFAVRTVDLAGRLYPATDDGLRPGLKVLVDTLPPAVILRPLAPRDGHVGAEWEVRDENLDPATLRLEYRSQGGGPWLPVRIDAVPIGRGYWNPMANGPLEARMTAADTAGNVGEAKINLNAAASSPPPGESATRLVNSKRINLNYRLEDVGPSGAVVELWYTRDARTWQKHSEDKNPRPPFIVDVSEEGRYGFTLVVHSGVGLGDRAPQTGDTPQIWVEVDWTKPVVQLHNVEVGRGLEAGNLTVTWTATDKNLARAPIALSYAEHPEGPWTPIAANLENTGRYIWRLPPTGIPYQFHVRVEAVDLAGNVGSAQTPTLVKVDLSRPKVSILDVGAAGK